MELATQFIVHVMYLVMLIVLVHVMGVVIFIIRAALALQDMDTFLALATPVRTIQLVVVTPRSMPLMYGYSIKYFKEKMGCCIRLLEHGSP